MAEIAILGPGAVGAFIAAAVARDGTPVTLIGREPTVAHIGHSGINVQSPRFGAFDVRVATRRRLEEEAEVLVVAVKAPQLAGALDRVTVEPRAVVPLLNGIDHVEQLRQHFSCPVIPATINVQAFKEDATHVVHRVDLARVTVATPGHLALEKALRRAGFDIGQHAEENDLLWRKLCRLASLALATAAADAPLGEVRDDAEAIAAEVVPIANAAGADVDLDSILTELRELADDSSSSLRTDIGNGAGESELAAITDPIVRVGKEKRLKCPIVKKRVATIKKQKR